MASRYTHLRSCSRFSRSRECPWCCILTHNLFISEKLRLMKSIVSWTVPESDPVLHKHKQQHAGFPTVTSLCAFIPVAPCSFFDHIRKHVLGALQQVVAEEQAAQRVLDAATHLDEILENVFARELVRLDVNNSHGDQKVPKQDQPMNQRISKCPFQKDYVIYKRGTMFPAYCTNSYKSCTRLPFWNSSTK